jgi:hypothetical protein
MDLVTFKHCLDNTILMVTLYLLKQEVLGWQCSECLACLQEDLGFIPLHQNKQTNKKMLSVTVYVYNFSYLGA